ncbi:MAG: hypothetical protein FWE91_08430 [Defluviitaleaceae bacterium]|nr:hypothetical protein [Defluviitaleaceae bacterium]MCL2835286.1 hypothetical protein [Defluviitaleaceae bacterium]
MNDKNEHFRKLYRAHDKIAAANKRLLSLYASATAGNPKIDGMPKSQLNPHRFDNTMVNIIDMQKSTDDLLKQRAEFDMFLFSLSYEHMRLLNLRFENCLTWKEIASELDLSTDSVKRIYGVICKKAVKEGLFDKLDD